MRFAEQSAPFSRRRFLSKVILETFGVFTVLSCKRETSTITTSGSVPKTDDFVIDFGADGPEVPRLIFFPECRKAAAADTPECVARRVRVTRLTFAAPTDPRVKFTFSNGREITLQGFGAGSSFSRGAVVIRSANAWLLDHAFRVVRERVPADYYSRVQNDFRRLQHQEVLGAASIRAVAELHKEIRGQKKIRGVKWESSASFTLDAVA